jgi:hypothetical protein
MSLYVRPRNVNNGSPRKRFMSLQCCHSFVCFLICLYRIKIVVTFSTKSSWTTPAATSHSIRAVSSTERSCVSRRKAFVSIATTSLLVVDGPPLPVVWSDDTVDMVLPLDTTTTTPSMIELENRDRKGNQDAVIRDDYWYVTGKLPPRVLTTQLKGDDPQWNAFGSCTTSESTGTNSCTYVSINQRRSAYNKYASSIAYGASEYQKLGTILDAIHKSLTSSSSSGNAPQQLSTLWQDAADLVSQPPYETSIPSATVDAELKMVLFATAMLTSPNFPGPSRELLVARFYANEVRFAHRKLYDSIQERNLSQAQLVYAFGRDSWNSYFQTVARSIVPKVGDPLRPIQ